MRGMLILMGFPQDATIIEEDDQACVYASEIPHMTRGMRHLDLAELLITSCLLFDTEPVFRRLRDDF